VADHYQILGVAKQASAADIRKAYLKLAKERHPDRFPDPVEKEQAQTFFKQLTEAFNTLSNEKGRRDYDASLEKPKASAPEELAWESYGNGLKKLESRDYQDAMELFRTAVQLLPKEAKFHAALAKVLVKNPHWVREGIQSLERATQLAPKNATYHAELAELFHSQGLKLRARRELEAAEKLAPADGDVKRVAALIGEPQEGES
jgi:DnaJ-class molecular chaperone